ncbi:MAG: Fic family protein, partial [Vicinamibacterales bacterium]
WEGWLTFFLRGVADVSLEAADTARKILAVREDHRLRITNGLGRAAGSGQRVLDHLYERPIISVVDVRALTQTSFQSANQLVQRLVEIGVLAEITGQARHRRFRYDPYVNLFS